MYDAIVAGAGPAGSTAAIVLAQSGMRTLLLDREEFPREKACGDAVPMPGFKILQDLNVTFGPDDLYTIDHVYVRGPRGISIKLGLTHDQEVNHGIVSRYVFDEAIFKHAVASGAEFCKASVQGPIIENGKVVGVKAKVGRETVEYHSKVVIAADGATSTIARDLNPVQRSDKDTAIALRGYVESDVDLDPTIDLVFLSEVQPGYAWFFPMNKRLANIGVGIRTDMYKRQDKTLQDMLSIYLKSPEINARVGNHKVTGIKSWQLPLNLIEQKRVFDGAILVGDAGGFVDPLTGAGIYQAVLTGKRAAEAAVAAIIANDTSASKLALYDKLWKQDIGGDIKRSATVYRAVALLPSFIDAMLVLARGLPGLVPYVLGKI